MASFLKEKNNRKEQITYFPIHAYELKFRSKTSRKRSFFHNLGKGSSSRKEIY